LTPYDIVFVHLGQSASIPYETPANGYQFQANNQYLVGEGTSLRVPSLGCGQIALWSQGASPIYPVIMASGTGSGVAINLGGSRTDVTVDHIKITSSPVGISSGTGLQAGAVANVNDVQIVGTAAGQRGVELTGTAGTFNLTSLSLSNLTRDGIAVIGSGSASDIRVNLTKSNVGNTTGSGVLVQNVTGTAGRVSVVDSSIKGSTGAGVFVGNANASVFASTLSANQLAGVFVQDAGSSAAGEATSNVLIASSKISDSSVGIWGMVNTGTTNLTITDNTIGTRSSPRGANGIVLSVDSGTTGQLNAAVIGNRITPTIGTVLSTGSNISTSGSSTLYNPQTFSSIGNIVLTTTGTLTNTGSTASFTPAGKMSIKASDLLNLQSLNDNAGVATVPLPLNATVTTITTGTVLVSGTPTTIITGTQSYQTVVIPPPPNYNAALIVPLPPQ
jgi:hypothetical protein